MLQAKDNNPLISLIMPVYNSESFLKEALNSLLNQDFREFELLLIDDGSNDNSLQIAEQYKSMDFRIKIYRTNHQGAAVARNKGLTEALGYYIYFVDSDDLFKKNMLSELYSKAVLSNADITICGFRKFDNATKQTIWEFRPNGKYLVTDRIETEKIEKELFDTVPPSPWGKLIKKTLIDSNNLSFQSLTSCNDFAFTYTALSCAKNLSFCNEILLYYRANTGKNISADRGSRAINILFALCQLRDQLKQNGTFDKYYETYIGRGRKSIEFELKNCNQTQKQEFYNYAKEKLPEKELKDLKVEYFCA